MNTKAPFRGGEFMQEIERKFKVLSDQYKSEATGSHRIVQGYLCRVPERTVRIRLKDDKGFITIKGKSDDSGLSRYEWEKEIPAAEARELLRLCEPYPIDKTRYEVPCGGHTFEVDEFHGRHEGLVVAEVELSNGDEPFSRPEWLGEEVTGQVEYYNAYLSKR